MFGPDCHGLSQSKTTKPKRPESRVVQSTIKLTEDWPTVFHLVLLL